MQFLLVALSNLWKWYPAIRRCGASYGRCGCECGGMRISRGDDKSPVGNAVSPEQRWAKYSKYSYSYSKKSVFAHLCSCRRFAEIWISLSVTVLVTFTLIQSICFVILVRVYFVENKVKILFVMVSKHIIGQVVQCYDDVKNAIKFVFLYAFILFFKFFYFIGSRNWNLYWAFITWMYKKRQISTMSSMYRSYWKWFWYSC